LLHNSKYAVTSLPVTPELHAKEDVDAEPVAWTHVGTATCLHFPDAQDVAASLPVTPELHAKEDVDVLIFSKFNTPT
jgi:hypothetical protein